MCSKHLQTNRASEEKSNLCFTTQKRRFQTPQGSLGNCVVSNPTPKSNLNPNPNPKTISIFSFSPLLGCVSIFSGKQGVQLQPHILLLSLSKLHTNPTKISIPALGLPTGFFQPCFVGLHQAPIFDLTHRLPPSINTNPTSSSLFYCSSPPPPPPPLLLLTHSHPSQLAISLLISISRSILSLLLHLLLHHEFIHQFRLGN